MKRTIFITIGSIIILLVFSFWVYLLLFGAPKPIENAFTNLGFGSPTPIDQTEDSREQTATLNINSGTLVQLTTKPVAGFDFIENSSSTTKLRYSERGTGHIFEVDLESGIETRVSAKTHLAVIDSVFSKDGDAVAIVSEDNLSTKVSLEELGDRETKHKIPESASNLKFIGDNKLLYTTTGDSGAIGYVYDLEEVTIEEVFAAPLSDIIVSWGQGETLIVNRPAPSLRSSIYRVLGGSLNKVASSAYNLNLIAPETGSGLYLVSYVDLDNGGEMTSEFFYEDGGNRTEVPITAYPEKCAFSYNTNTVWCASDSLPQERENQSEWYKGQTSFSDLIWEIDTRSGRTILLDNLFDMTGRQIDVIDLTASENGRYLLFKNKLDDTLWLKKLSRPQSLPDADAQQTPVQ